ncbi:PilT protein domain-containing protein [Candidatus Protofrankia californiensis]|uniref:PilT protein domain-containing protein n=1 Tax=Candidatus Protofrankia californiensis TaxID=1839754 RepID=A0A1C3P667_9ACTN|nr:PilT protein domain-containing protein [Candidatus Protofrankia californiensis]
MASRVYLDTSAVAKLFVAEKESSDLRRWLASHPEPPMFVSSALLGVELARLLGLVNPAMVDAANSFLAADVDIVEITPPVLGDAASVPPPRLRTLDAIHLATALDLRNSLDVMLTYDKVLAEAARTAGLAVACPGAAY